MGNSSNGTATPKQKAELKDRQNGKPVQKAAISKSVTAKEPSPEQLARQRIEKRIKLNALYDDIEKLNQAHREFDSIQSFGELSVAIRCGDRVAFMTSRTDTVNEALDVIQSSIDRKLEAAYKQLAEFSF